MRTTRLVGGDSRDEPAGHIGTAGGLQLSLSDASFKAVKPLAVLPLSNDTHVVPDPLVNERLWKCFGRAHSVPGLRHAEGWTGDGAKIHEARFHAQATPGEKLVSEGDPTALWARDTSASPAPSAELASTPHHRRWSPIPCWPSPGASAEG
ncbi:MAG: hypothetical protein INH41_01635 [Myxococcaceae bacterium]|nr:hypothetical protein [Myxococcaceae bacterium]MCA3011080.1 hypothetical protein [Myxococcaceae bacterium]